eukprot:7190381-Ditylum_brightwellii.AAC.1
MEKALFQQHIEHFKEAQPTPMAQLYLANMFRPYAETEFCQQYWEGKADIVSLETDTYTKEFLQELQRKQSDPHR